MRNIEKSYGIELELKDLDTSKRTAVIKHAVYTSIDRVDDIATKGMFAKSWTEKKPNEIGFLFNHMPGAKVGNVKSVFEDDNGAYTEVKFGNWTLGNDVLEMAVEGVLDGASFGYVTHKKEYIQVKNRKVRKLKEVSHEETSLLTLTPAHPEAGIISMNKAFSAIEYKRLSENEQNFLKNLLINDQDTLRKLLDISDETTVDSDLYTWVMWQINQRSSWIGDIRSQFQWSYQQVKSIKAHVDHLEKYCRKAHASDETIILLQSQIEEYKKVISDYNTALTHNANEPIASGKEINEINNFINSLNLETWQKKNLSLTNSPN